MASEPNLWRSRCREAASHLGDITGLLSIYLISELSIWGLSLVLISFRLEHFATIILMLSVFSIFTALAQLVPGQDDFYHRRVKSRVDFINANLGIGFTVPIVMMDHALNIRDISVILAVSVVTNIVSWTTIFCVTRAVLMLIDAIQSVQPMKDCHQPSPQSCYTCGSRAETYTCSFGRSHDSRRHIAAPDPSFASGTDQSELLERPSEDNQERHLMLSDDDGSLWCFCKKNGYLFMSFFGVVAAGLPTELIVHDSRALDAFTLWLCWITTVRVQRIVKSAPSLAISVRCWHALAALMNPVLVTALLMLAYTRLKGMIGYRGDISSVLDGYSSGIPLHSIWTSIIVTSSASGNPWSWFRAGDFALSLLECGIITWGFKLYECRSQLFSVSGLVVVLLCAIFAAGNVFLPVLLAGALGLPSSTTLAFAARSTTLALSQQAVKALSGDSTLNATLVVGNGILGQLFYPYIPDRILLPTPIQTSGGREDEDMQSDNPTTVAAGATIGINGAAMGVSYLYEVKSRAAPYAALSMTSSGIMTVAFTTLEPFKSLAVKLASGSSDS